MVFSSISFIFFFLPIFIILFYLIKPLGNLKFIFILFASLLFYFWGENFLIWILLTSTFIDFFMSRIIESEYDKGRASINKKTDLQKIALTTSIMSNLAFLGYFKYANFFIDILQSFVTQAGLSQVFPISSTAILLPLGISFYTFQSMSYTIDVYRRKVKATKNPIKFAAYVTMFPQLVAGPIVRYSDIEDQFNNHKITTSDFIIGMRRFIIGLSKKVLIANTFAAQADKIFALSSNELSTGIAWIGIILYVLQLYFDFSGYSCMAIGLGRMVGFRFPENFNYPYISKSIREFWQRWHMTLGSWFRDYLYFPLGGSKKGIISTYRNLIIVFTAVGFWHGANWNFIFFGFIHGILLVLERQSFFKNIWKTSSIIQHLYFIFVFLFSEVFFRIEDISKAINFQRIMLGINSSKFDIYLFKEVFQTNVIITFVIAIIFCFPVLKVIQKKMDNLSITSNELIHIANLLVLVLLFILSASSLALGTSNPFIYFRF